MNYTLHLTEKCNLRCKYCYEEKGCKELSFEDIKNIFDLAIKNNDKKPNITFFGGEPLLKKDLIYKSIEYAEKLEKENDVKFYYKMNTNGTLLDDEFIQFAKKKVINICYSIDGDEATHNLNRQTTDGKDTFSVVHKNAQKLLKSQPYSIAMMVITLNNIEQATTNVEYLFKLGFKYIVCAIDYTAKWNDEYLEKLKIEFEKMADLYYEKTLREDSFYLLPFEDKMDMHIDGKNHFEMCHLGLHGVDIGADGKIYPCMQFVGVEEYEIGDCKNGVDYQKQQALMKKSCKEYEICKECAIRERCRHTCGCVNFLTTGDINIPSALTCEKERMLITITDKLAEKLYKKRANGFIQKKYNKLYPFIETFEFLK